MAPPTLPHIILLIMDSASAKRFSVYGHWRDTTPGLRRLAADAVVYQYCFAPSTWTLPSHASLFTGLYPSEHGCINFLSRLTDDFFSLAEILQQMGYNTVGLTSNGLIYSFRRGFDEMFQMQSLFSMAEYELKNAIKAARPVGLARTVHLLHESLRNKKYFFPIKDILDRLYRKYWADIYAKSYRATERSIRLSKKIIKKCHECGQPLFLFINFMDLHWQYRAPKNYLPHSPANPGMLKKLWSYNIQENYLRDDLPEEEIYLLKLLYDQEIAYLDNRIYHLYQFLVKHGWQDNTMFVVTTDHGESLGEHGIWAHTLGLYNEVLHIPLIIKYPREYRLQGENHNLVQLHDLYATLLEMAGSPFPMPDSSWSLLGPPRREALAELPDTSMILDFLKRRRPEFQNGPQMQSGRCLIDSQLHKLIQWADGRCELYNLKADYAEERNLAADPTYEPVRETLRQRLADLTGPWDNTPEPET